MMGQSRRGEREERREKEEGEIARLGGRLASSRFARLQLDNGHKTKNFVLPLCMQHILMRSA